MLPGAGTSGSRPGPAGVRVLAVLTATVTLWYPPHGALAAAASSANAVPAPPITEIRFAGNRKTRGRVMLQEMLVGVGDPADPALIESSRQAIMDLELFKSVHTQLDSTPGGQVLLITVEEKYYTLPLPVLSRNADGDITYGVEMRMDNLGGLNQKFKARYKVKDFADGEVDREETLSLDYAYPRIAGSRYELRLSLDDENERVDAERKGRSGLYNREYREARLAVRRWLAPSGPSKGWQLGAGLVAYDVAYDHLGGADDLFQGGQVMSVRLAANFSDVHDYLYSRSGREYGYQVDIADEAFGSDISFVKHDLYWRSLNLVTSRPHTNLNLQLRFGSSSDDLFGEPFYRLGGSSSLRGYDRDRIRGNAMLNANLEFLTPLRVGYPALRGVLFADAGNAWQNFNDIDLGDIQFAVGAGMRWTVKYFVRFTLSLDAAYAVDGGETKVFVGTGNTF